MRDASKRVHHDGDNYQGESDNLNCSLYLCRHRITLDMSRNGSASEVTELLDWQA